MKSHPRIFSVIGAVVLGLAPDFSSGAKPAAELAAVMPEKHFEVFENYCLDCHDADTQKGKLNLEELFQA